MSLLMMVDKEIYRSWRKTDSELMAKILTKIHHVINPKGVLHPLNKKGGII